VGQNANDLVGCFDLSNPITVVRNLTEAGMIALEDGSTETSICVDGVVYPLTVVLSGETSGSNSTFVITDDANNILAIPGGNGPFDLDPAGPGTCLIWYLTFEDGLQGAAVGQNANDLVGCFDLSNPITVVRNQPEAGMIALADGSTETSICVDGVADPLEVVMSGETSGSNSTFVITDDANNILAIPGNNGPFDLDPAGPGTCLIWYLTFEDGLQGAAVGQNANDLVGCFDLSNPITVVRNEPSGGMISLEGGDTAVTICAGDGTDDPLTIIRDGNAVGTNRTFVITDAATNEILAIPDNNGPFNLEGAGGGVCDIWYLAFEEGLVGLETGANLDDLMGCFALSNPVVVTRQTGDDCTGGNLVGLIINEVAVDGMIELFNGADTAVNVSSYWLCNFPAYQQISQMNLECGELLIQPGEYTVISGFSGFDAADAELGLYTSSSFGSSDAIISYLEWGSTGHQRSSVAVQAGVWTSGLFVDPPTNTESQQVTLDDNNELVWELATPTLCAENDQTNPIPPGVVGAQVTVFPNPAIDYLNLEVSGMAGEVSMVAIYDLNGRMMLEARLKAPNGRSRVALPNSPAGTYVVRVVNNNRVATARFNRF
ncbi:MAG: T9SS type A sorting domain-containing protein, partial [Bacteroidota bacterium]